MLTPYFEATTYYTSTYLLPHVHTLTSMTKLDYYNICTYSSIVVLTITTADQTRRSDKHRNH